MPKRLMLLVVAVWPLVVTVAFHEPVSVCPAGSVKGGVVGVAVGEFCAAVSA